MLWPRLCRQRVRLCLASLSLIPLVVFYSLLATDTCTSTDQLASELNNTATFLRRYGIEFYINYGTLLGAAREHTVLAFDRDSDIAMSVEDCRKLTDMKAEAAAYGLRVFGRKDWIPVKASWIRRRSGYLRKTCVRLYSRNGDYVDAYDYALVKAADVPRFNGTLRVPEGYTPADGDLTCSVEGFTVGDGPGGCHRVRDVYPLTQLEISGLIMPAPRNYDGILSTYYGDWRTPRRYDAKFLVCSVVPSSPVAATLLIALLLLLPAAILAWPLRRPALDSGAEGALWLASSKIDSDCAHKE